MFLVNTGAMNASKSRIVYLNWDSRLPLCPAVYKCNLQGSSLGLMCVCSFVTVQDFLLQSEDLLSNKQLKLSTGDTNSSRPHLTVTTAECK